MQRGGRNLSELNIDDESAAQYTRATDCISRVSESSPTHLRQPEEFSSDTHANDLQQHHANSFIRSEESDQTRESNLFPDATDSITAALHRSNSDHDGLHTSFVPLPSFQGRASPSPTQQVDPENNTSDTGRGYYITGYVDSNGTLLYTMPMYEMFSTNIAPYPALLHPVENSMPGQGIAGVHSASLAQTPTSQIHPPNRNCQQNSRREYVPADARRSWSGSTYAEYPPQQDVPHHPFIAPYPYMYYSRTHTGVMQPMVDAHAPRYPLPDVQPESQVAACDRDTSLESGTPEDLSQHSSGPISPLLTTVSRSLSPKTSRQCDVYHRRHHSFDVSRSLKRNDLHKQRQKSFNTLHRHRGSSESAAMPLNQFDSGVLSTTKRNATVDCRDLMKLRDKHSSGARLSEVRGRQGSYSSHTSSGETFPLSSSLDFDASLNNRNSASPSPTSKRSEFVMWCGNVPADASQEELWQFFTQTADSLRSQNAPLQSAPQDTHGVLSIFLMSRSRCAFVNFSSAQHLNRACSLFHDKKFRQESSSPPLVCRARRSEDVEHAGVAAQRGKGVHTSWYRKEKQQQTPISMEANDIISSRNSSDSVSFTSTDSSLLSQPQFADRFFILKSRNSEALKTALRTNIWSTQTHNEPVLDQAFRNSEKVTLFFSENHSGHFFGYATMASRIGAACHTEDWRSNSHSSSSETSASSISRFGSPDSSEDSEQLNASRTNRTRSNEDQVGSSAARYRSAAGPSQPFYISWVNTEPLPFRKINKLRNPWRDNRLVKVSRDGTELEPHVGRQLLSIWESTT